MLSVPFHGVELVEFIGGEHVHHTELSVTDVENEILFDVVDGVILEAEDTVDREEAVPVKSQAEEAGLLPLAALVGRAQDTSPAQQEAEYDTTVDVHDHWQDRHAEQLARDTIDEDKENAHMPKHCNKEEEDDDDNEVSISPASSHSLSRSPSPQYSPPLGMLHSSPLPIPHTNLVDISRSPSPLDIPKPAAVVIPPSPIVSWSWDAGAHDDEDRTGMNDAWGFGTAEEKVEGSSMDVRDGEDLIRFDGGGNDGDAIVDFNEDCARASGDIDLDEPVGASVMATVEEEAWFAEESTIVCYDVRDNIELRHDIADKYVLLHAEEKGQVLEHVYEENLLLESNMNIEVEPLGSQTPILVHDQPPEAHDDNNDIHEKLPTSTIHTPILQPLSIPLTLSEKDQEDLLDPDLLPLPLSPTSRKTALPSIAKASAQTPMPPASPPKSPWRLRPLPISLIQEEDVDLHVSQRSNFLRPASPMSAQATPSTSDSPAAVFGEQGPVSTPDIANSAVSARPAWSFHAGDAPALGIPTQSDDSDVGMRIIRSSPDMRLRARSFVEVAEKGEAAERGSIVSVMKDDFSGKHKGKEDFPLPAPIKLSTSLPGSFPFPKPTPAPLPPPPSQTSAQSTAVTSSLGPGIRRRTPRSPLDIALAMQLRPGLGLGADPAWMVRFLMSMFGWLAVLISGRGDFDMYMYAGGVRGGL
jgi:hypothetical protein